MKLLFSIIHLYPKTYDKYFNIYVETIYNLDKHVVTLFFSFIKLQKHVNINSILQKVILTKYRLI